jgi:hypothetical protein
MKICGITIQGKRAAIVVLECADDQYTPCRTISKIDLSDDKSQEDMRACLHTFQAFIRDHGIDLILLKARARSGEYAGGAVGFKIEAIIQLLDIPVEIINANAVSAAIRGKALHGIDQVYAYQKDAFKVAFAGYLRKC